LINGTIHQRIQWLYTYIYAPNINAHNFKYDWT
jgi:hypothetical protein